MGLSNIKVALAQHEITCRKSADPHDIELRLGLLDLLVPLASLDEPFPSAVCTILAHAVARGEAGLSKQEIQDELDTTVGVVEQHLTSLKSGLLCLLRSADLKLDQAAMERRLEEWQRQKGGRGGWRVLFENESGRKLTIAVSGTGLERRVYVVNGDFIPPREGLQRAPATHSAAATRAHVSPPPTTEADRARDLSAAHYRASGWPEDERFVEFDEHRGIISDLGAVDCRAVAITGVGGVGKSALARHIARTCRDSYPFLFFLRAEGVRQLRQGLASLAYRLGLVKPDDSRLDPSGGQAHRDPSDGALEALRLYRFPAPCLIVLDNLGDATDGVQETVSDPARWAAIQRFLPVDERVKYILTCQAFPECPPGTPEPVEVRLQTIEEQIGIEFLLKRSGLWRDEPNPTLSGDAIYELAREVVRLLHEGSKLRDSENARVLPLALDTVAGDLWAYRTNEREDRLGKWPGLLADLGSVLGRDFVVGPRRYGVAKTLAAVMRILGEESSSVTLLEAMAWLGAERIPLQVLYDALAFPSTDALDQALEPIVRRGLVRLEEEPPAAFGLLAGSLSIHRTLQAVLRVRQGGKPATDLLARLTRLMIQVEVLPFSLFPSYCDVWEHKRELRKLGAADHPEIWAILRLLEFINNSRLRPCDGVDEALADLLQACGTMQPSCLDLDYIGLSDITCLAGLDKLLYLSLKCTYVSDLSSLASLVNLRFLGLSKSTVTDVAPLAGLVSLMNVDLSMTKVPDVSPLAGLVNLRELNLFETNVWDVSPLASLPRLTRVILPGWTEWNPQEGPPPPDYGG